jgi:hypothetical protein
MIFSPNFSFKEFFRNLLPHYIVIEDSYKDSNDQGLFERYFVLFGENLDDEKAQQIDEYLNIIDPQICEGKFLTHISDTLGNPPDVFLVEEQYRNLLYYIVSIYKIKGTKKAYALFFAILGFVIEIEEIPLLTPTSNYDNDADYDNDLETDVYDQNVCQPCSFYTIKFYYADNNESLSLQTLGLLRAAIDFNEPINAKLKSLVIVINLEDGLSFNLNDEITETTEIINNYDSGFNYDTETIINVLGSEQEEPDIQFIITEDGRKIRLN